MRKFDKTTIGRMLLSHWASSRVHQLSNECGTGLQVEGRPHIENRGTLLIGNDVHVRAHLASTRLLVGPNASLSIGDASTLDYGSTISARIGVEVGKNVAIGPNVFIVDSNVGDPDLHSEESKLEPITIGDDVTLENGAIVLRGSHIGNRAHVIAGSVVAGRIPPYTLARGNPARIVGLARPHRFHETLAFATHAFPEKPAIIWNGRVITYLRLSDRARRLAEMLRKKANIERGDRVVFCSARKLDFISALYGVAIAGGISVPASAVAAPSTVRELLEVTNSRTLLVDEDCQERYRKHIPEDIQLVTFLDETEGASYQLPPPFISEQPDPHGSSDDAIILFTSGTSARSKGVVLTHRNLIQASMNMNDVMRLDSEVTEYVSVPLSHSFGLGRIRSVVAVGGTLVLDDGPLNPATMVHSMKAYNCNGLSTVPAGLSMFWGTLEQSLRTIGSHVEVIELGSAFMSPSEKARLLQVFPRARIYMHYGLTEASRSTFLDFRAESDKLTTVGRPSPNVRIDIRDGDGKICPIGREGEIVIHGAHVTPAYLGNPKLTAQSFTEDGGFRTGDFGSLDSDGYLHLKGRKDDIINCGGVKISPLELEEKIATLFQRIEVCVVGMPDPQGLVGFVPVVAYCGAQNVSNRELCDALKDLVDPAKLPYATIRVDEIPRTDNGKPLRRILEVELEGRVLPPSRRQVRV